MRRSLARPAPVPPGALLTGQIGIAGLRDRRTEDVEHTRVLAHAGLVMEPTIQSFGVLSRQLSNGADTQQLEIPPDRWTD